MLSADNFKSIPKIDAHNHMNLGMLYSSYKKWAGFEIPDFPRRFSGLAEMHEIIANYTRPRCKTADDVRSLLTMCIEDAISDNVKTLEGSVDMAFAAHCGGVDAFLAVVDALVKRYAGKIDFRPELGIGKIFDFEKTTEWAPECIKSGVFKSIDLYGPEVDDGLEKFVPVFEAAGKAGLKKKCHAGEFSSAQSVMRLAQLFSLDEIQHGIRSADDVNVVQFLIKNNIRLNITPASNVNLSAVPSLTAHPIKRLVDAGVRVSIGTDDLLFFNRSISEQCADLVNAGVFSEIQLQKLLAQ
ncbi:MAG: adenosine deaminase [Treponemataceae bacterium]|nr:MAG: adenosine deaminase [Treponemataceae bacterium]